MKKVCLVVLFLLLSLSLVVGCSAPEKTSVNDGQSNALDEQGKIVITVGHGEPDGRSVHDSFIKFAEYVKEKTNGQVEVQIFPNAQLGSERQMVESVSLGSLDMCSITSAVLTTYSENFCVLDLPFLFQNRDAAYAAVDGKLGEQLSQLIAKNNLHVLGWQDNGLRNISNSVRPINEPDDLKGIKIRVMESPLYIDSFKALGANPTPMAFGELYTALQQKTVDAQDNGSAIAYTMKFYEVQEYFSLTNHVYSLNPLLINKNFFDRLPQNVQDIIKDGTKQFLMEMQRNEEASSDANFVKKLIDTGMKVNEITEENRQKFVEKTKPVYDIYEKKIGKEIIDLALSFNE